MDINVSRRSFLSCLVINAVVIGFDPVNRSWITKADARSGFEALPPLDGVLYTDNTILSAADDFGHIIKRQPIAVLKPASVEDIILVINFARDRKLKIAARGQGHSCYGQSQVEAGIIIDTSTLNKIHAIGADRVDVDAGVVWSQLLKFTLETGLTPPVLTDYIELSVGGTLSVGGIGGATHRYGVQVDNVLELQVITGSGKLEICSPYQNKDLFSAVLGGLGQCGIIVRATIRLIRASKQARVFMLYYDDINTFTRDQRSVIADNRFNYVEGQIVPKEKGGWQYMLEAASFYTSPSEPDNASLLAGLNYNRGTEQIEDKSYPDFLNRLAPVVATLKSIGVWTNPHPWLNVFVPGTAVEQYISSIVSTLTQDDTGQSPILLYPVLTSRFGLPFFRVPDESIVFLFAILRTAPVDANAIARMLNDNRVLFERNRDLGGTRYPIDAIPFSKADWQQQFGTQWDRFVSLKGCYDPDNILTPGQGIF